LLYEVNLIGCITGLAHPSVPHELLAYKPKGTGKPKLVLVLVVCIVVRTSVLAGELSVFCAGLMDCCLTTLWVKRPLSVNQQDQLSLPSLQGRLNQHAVAVRLAALVSDEKRIRSTYATMRYTN